MITDFKIPVFGGTERINLLEDWCVKNADGWALSRNMGGGLAIFYFDSSEDAIAFKLVACK